MNLLEIFILEFLAIDALAARPIALCEVTALDHEGLDHAVEAGAFVVERLAGLANALFAGAKAAEVLGGLRYDWREMLARGIRKYRSACPCSLRSGW